MFGDYLKKAADLRPGHNGILNDVSSIMRRPQLINMIIIVVVALCCIGICTCLYCKHSKKNQIKHGGADILRTYETNVTEMNQSDNEENSKKYKK